MRRRRVLALGTAAVGLTGYRWYRGETEDEVADVTSMPTDAVDGLSGEPGDGTSHASATRGPLTKTPRLGGTLNGRPRKLKDDIGLIEKSDTTWLHAFLDVRKKLAANVTPRKDPDVVALRRAARETDVKLLVSLRWDFRGIWGDKEPTNVPAAGSNRESALFEYATKQLRAIGQPVDVLVLGNEPIWETLDEDVTGVDPPMVKFTRRLKAHLVRHYADDHTRLLVGSFNRLYDQEVWKEYNGFYRQLFALARNDDRIDGIDLHIHYSAIEEAESMLATAREAVPDGTITITEFSPMWRHVEKLDDRIDAFKGGGRFLTRHGLPDGMTVLQYFKRAKRTPRPRREMAAFMEVMPWYNVDFVTDTHDLLKQYDIDVATLGFLVGKGVRNMTWDEEWRPFQISFLFLRPLIATEDGAHPHYLPDYRKRT